ncbi:hypothetical protein MGYG_08779 [Nannizzia gypsea CBS 118893]|uniref:Uncharacterized protein n=1 Tax=Arthroderma gypseum (strain ATCC MYA-4604 / CBS 118893) TaxID=535722 RepID=E4V6Z3_ARTGP|nr:hypothetical protein MGYG_08779 [Nannizzia gypsea CBS 118893]EFQ96859.1 hypothetical protein MGYG_08779 [Nannizzia gypsea CBS 118893]
MLSSPSCILEKEALLTTVPTTLGIERVLGILSVDLATAFRGKEKGCFFGDLSPISDESTLLRSADD